MRAVASLFLHGRFQYAVAAQSRVLVVPTLEAWAGEWTWGEFDDSFYFYGGQARKRPACPVEVDGLVLRGVRPGSTIMIEGQQYECAEGGDVELSFQYPGSYEVTVTRWPYLEGRVTIENPPPVE